MARKKFYLTLDTETATLPFANEICKTATEKQRVAIAKPLVYDIGWTITDRKGNIIKQENYLIQETFFVPNVFNTAYYKDKRPIYMNLLEQGRVKTGTWDEVMKKLIPDLEMVDLTTAFNACFDFKKAIPFTERYIKALYSTDYNKWEQKQREKAKKIAKGKNDSDNPDYLKPWFELRGKKYPIADLWGVACEKLLNTDRYRDFCLMHGLLTASGQYFKSSAETAFQYLTRRPDFIEDHTALSDALIEAEILTKVLKKGKVEPTITAFPFRDLGSPADYVRKKKPKYKHVVRQAIEDYIESNDGEFLADCGNRYWQRVINSVWGLY